MHGVHDCIAPRLPHSVRQCAVRRAEVILARVVVGHCAKKTAVKEQRQLLRPEHREPPAGAIPVACDGHTEFGKLHETKGISMD